MEIKNGRKFAVIIIVSVLLFMMLIAGIVGAYNEFELPWLSVTMPILAGVYPTYIAGNVYQHIREVNKQGG